MNCAAYVRTFTPVRRGELGEHAALKPPFRENICREFGNLSRIPPRNPLDMASEMRLNIFTLRSLGKVPHATPAPPLQDRCPAPAQFAQPASRQGARQAVRLAPVLRSPRSGPGPLRDAALRAPGRHLGQRERPALRRDPSHLVPRPARLRRRRPAGLGARQAGPQAGPQAARGGGRGLARRAGRAARAALPAAGGAGARALRARGAPPQRRARTGAQKK